MSTDFGDTNVGTELKYIECIILNNRWCSKEFYMIQVKICN